MSDDDYKKRVIARKPDIYFVQQESTVVGVVEFRPRDMCICDFAIFKQYRGKGFGGQALRLLIKEIRAKYPNKSITLGVAAKNKPAVSLYEKVGFIVVEQDTDGSGYMKMELKPDVSVEALNASMEASSGLSQIAIKKKKILDFICKLCDTMEPSGFNSKRYRGMIEKMSDREFDQFMNYMKEGKWQLNLVAPNMLVNLRNEDLLKACDLIGLDLFQRIWIHDRATGKKYLTDNKYMFLQLPIRRQQQFLDEKMRVPDDDKTIDQLSGQVTGDSRACAITTPEIHILAARGLSETLQELVNVRGGNIANYNEFRRSLEETGEADLDTLDPNSRTRSSVVATKLLQSMMLDTNL